MIRARLSIALFFGIIGIVEAQPALIEPAEFPAVRPGPRAVQSGVGCFHLASGTITPGDVDWVQISMPRATTQTVVDVDFPANGGGSALLASIVSGTTAFNIADNNNSRDAFCGLSATTVPPGSTRDSAAFLGATARNVVMNVGVTGAEDTGFVGAHSQTFSYDVWVYALTVPCTMDADCGDGVVCTVDTCDAATGDCFNDVDDAACDNGLFCDGEEFCDEIRGCRFGPMPDCDDGVACTIDDCDPVSDECVSLPDDVFCDNETFCDGEEWCDPVGDCQSGEPPACDDEIECTVDTCDFQSDDCLFTPDDGACSNGVFCDGVETCDPVEGCIAGDEPCPDQFCRESDDRCVDCLSDADCDDGDFCNGAETCDQEGLCVDGAPPCPPDVVCNPDAERCESGTFTLDIKPRKCPNRIKTNAQGQVTMAITGGAGADVHKIKMASLRLERVDGVGKTVHPNEGPRGPWFKFEDVTTPFYGETCACHKAEGDGQVDLVVRFSVQAMSNGLRLDKVPSESSLALRISGRLRDGTKFEVIDCIVVERRGRKDIDR